MQSSAACGLPVARASVRSPVSQPSDAEAERAVFPYSPARGLAAEPGSSERTCPAPVPVLARSVQQKSARQTAHRQQPPMRWLSKTVFSWRVLPASGLCRQTEHLLRSFSRLWRFGRFVGRRQGDHHGSLVAHQKFLHRCVHLVQRHCVFLIQNGVNQVWVVEINGIATDQNCGKQRGPPALDELPQKLRLGFREFVRRYTVFHHRRDFVINTLFQVLNLHSRTRSRKNV